MWWRRKQQERVSPKPDLVLVKLTAAQVENAKAVNGRRKRITHALLCGPYGQIFGTENQCRKYFDAWRPEHRIEVRSGHFQPLFPNLFRAGVEEQAEIVDFRTTHNLVTRLIEAQLQFESG